MADASNTEQFKSARFVGGVGAKKNSNPSHPQMNNEQDVSKDSNAANMHFPPYTHIQQDVSYQETMQNPVFPSVPGNTQPDISQFNTTRFPNALPAQKNGLPPGMNRPTTSPTTTAPKGFFGKQRAKYNNLSKKSKIILAVLLVALLIPTFTIIVEGINTYLLYSQARTGIQHLLNIKDIFTGPQSHTNGLLDIKKLHDAQPEIDAAHSDFLQLQQKLDQDLFIGALGNALPQQISSARALSHIGVDATEMGQQLLKMGINLAPTFRDPLLATSTKPIVTPALLDTVRTNIDFMLPRMNDIEAHSHSVSLDSLPLSDKQRQQLTQVIQIIPQAKTYLTEGRDLLGAIGWILGVDAPRTFLVQTMDRAELRPTGGFTGQFGELKINGGHMAPFSLQNIGPFEEFETILPSVKGQNPPAPYDTWWPVPNWGVRDSNLSADFPTSAMLTSEAYKREFNTSVDGVIVFSPFLIARILQATGPLTVPRYNETITAQNLEDKLHYYQLNNEGIYKEEVIEHVNNADEARKLFTKEVSNLIMDHARHAPPDELISLSSAMLYALQTKDLQVYVKNQQIQDTIKKYGSNSQIDTSTTHDGLFVVQANVSASKASQDVRTIMQDTVTLDATGGATHMLKIRLAYTQVNDVYGLNTYRDYIRIYTPPSSQLRWASGFDQGQNHPLCGVSTGFGACPDDPYKDGTLLCPSGQMHGGYAAYTKGDAYYGRDHPIDKIGGPTNTDSDMSGRNMYGGWVTVPKNCTMNVSLSWYVPAMGQAPYSLLLQRQSSTFPLLDLTILPTSGNCQTSALYFNGVLNGPDRTFTLPTKQATQTDTGCSPQLHV